MRQCTESKQSDNNVPYLRPALLEQVQTFLRGPAANVDEQRARGVPSCELPARGRHVRVTHRLHQRSYTRPFLAQRKGFLLDTLGGSMEFQ